MRENLLCTPSMHMKNDLSALSPLFTHYVRPPIACTVAALQRESVMVSPYLNRRLRSLDEMTSKHRQALATGTRAMGTAAPLEIDGAEGTRGGPTRVTGMSLSAERRGADLLFDLEVQGR